MHGLRQTPSHYGQFGEHCVYELVRHQAEERLRDDEALTPRQLEILRMVADGLSNREIGGQLGNSARTVDRHLTAIFAAFDVDRRNAAVARATALGLLQGARL
jgi:ATP/maltotriose-dependent transcriptional regulator MalT